MQIAQIHAGILVYNKEFRRKAAGNIQARRALKFYSALKKGVHIMKRLKSFFEISRKNVAFIVCVAASLSFLLTGASCAAGTAENDSSIGGESAQITLDKAKETALTDAGLTDSEVTFTKAKSDWDDGISVYDIEFYTENTEYEYEINASTGAIHDKSVEKFKVSSSDQTDIDTQQKTSGHSSKNSAQMQESDAEQISLDTAKNAALSDAGLSSSDVNYTETKLDYDDGVTVYDIEFLTSTHKYEYKIDAATGVIINKNVEIIRKNTGTTLDNTEVGDSYIGVDRAKCIAVEHASLSVSDVTFSKAKLENDDGYSVYEIEFYMNGTEYEYKIDAIEGTIVEYDCERN